MPTVLRSEKHKNLTPPQLVKHFEFGIQTWAHDVIEFLLSWEVNCAPDLSDGDLTGRSKFRTRDIRDGKGNLDFDWLESEFANPNGDFVIAGRLCSLVEVIARCRKASPYFSKGIQIIYPDIKDDGKELNKLIRNRLAHGITTRDRVQFDRHTKNFEKMQKLSGEFVFNVCVPEWYDEMYRWFSEYVNDLTVLAKNVDIEKDIIDFDKEYQNNKGRRSNMKKMSDRVEAIQQFIKDKNDFQRLYIFMCYPDESYG